MIYDKSVKIARNDLCSVQQELQYPNHDNSSFNYDNQPKTNQRGEGEAELWNNNKGDQKGETEGG